MITVPTILYALLTGLIVGTLSGIFGIGGGTIMIPVFRVAFMLPAAVVSATSLFCMIVTSFSGMLAHMKEKLVDLKTGLIIGGTGACVSWFGSYCSSHSPDALVMFSASAALLASAASMVPKAFFPKSRDKEPGPIVAKFQEAAKKKSGARYYITCLCTGPIVGFLAGFIGLGGGFIVIPLLSNLFGYDIKHSVGTSLSSIFMLAVPGVISHAILGDIYYIFGLIVLCGTIPGSIIGTRISTRMPDVLTRKLLIILVVAMGIVVVCNELFILG